MKHQSILSKLTLEQKVALLSGRDIWSTYPFEQAGLPAMFLSDGPHGVRRQVGEGDHLGLNASQPATCFPTAAGVANSWNPTLAEQAGQTIGEEAASQQVNVLLGPGLNIKRSPLGGRNFEYYSEDPYLAGKMAAAFIRGVQSNGISACPKHFAANSQEHLRMTSDSVVDERTLRELYLTGFEIAVKEGQPKSIMSSYNRINGTYANEDAHLLTEILRNEWGFDGFVVTDWGGSNDHVAGTLAGSNLEMPGTGGDSDRELLAALKDGSIQESVIDQRVDELIDVILSTHAATANHSGSFDKEAHHAVARQTALETAVLLKNQDHILPLSKETRVAVIGDMALEPRYQGAGSSVVNPTQLDRPIDCLSKSSLNIVGHAQGYLRNGKTDPSLSQAAVALAKQADVVLLYLGLPEIFESEGIDRTHMALPSNQNALVEELYQVNPNLVVILSGGSPVELPWIDHCKGLIHGYLGGQAGAGAMVDLLTGVVSPSGKLAETYPISYTDTPNYHYFPGKEETAEYRESLYVGYRYYETVQKPVRFPFGYGLSYTTFSYTDLTITPGQVQFTLTNTGDMAGSEISQLYISCPNSKLFRPVRELKGFAKTYLEPGASTRVTIPLDDKAFRYFNVQTDQWEIEGGTYQIEIGASCQDILLTGTLSVTGTDAPIPYDASLMPSYYSAKVQSVSDQEFTILLGRPLPESKWDRTAPLGFNDSLSQMQYARSPLARMGYKILQNMQKKSEANGAPDLNVLFIYNMPFRGLAKMTGGMISTEMAQAMQYMANGHFFGGCHRLIKAHFKNQKELKARKERI